MITKPIKLISVILSLMITLSAFGCFSGFAAENKSEETDSGVYDFTIEDATRIQRYCAYLEMLNNERETLYDVNFDGFVTICDASLIQMHIAGLIDIHSKEYQNQRQEGFTMPASPASGNIDFTVLASEESQTGELPTDEQIIGEIATDEPTTGEMTTEEPTEEPTTEEPTTVEPTTEEPATEEPTTVEPTTEPATAEPSATFVRFGLSTVYMGINETYKLIVDTDADEYTLSSSDASVANIDGSGTVLPKKIGTIVVTCTTSNGMKAECLVYVGQEATDLIMNAPTLTVGDGESFDLNSFTVGNGKFAANRYFYSTNENVVTVEPDTGIFKAVGLGNAKVICELVNGVSAECDITVLPYSNTIMLNTYSVTGGVGEPLGFRYFPESGKAAEVHEYRAENEDIVEIDKISGIMKGKAAGKTRIYCQIKNGYKIYAEVTILPAPKSVSLNATSCNIKVGDVIQLKQFYNDGSYNTPYTLEWTSSNRAVNIESRSGYLVTLKAKALGTSVITAKTYNGLTVKCTVTVKGSNVKCIDISSWQGSNVDFKKIKASGINYVIIRAGFRTTADNQFVNYYNKAKAAGLKIGSYWYMCAQNYSEAKAEAAACIQVLGGRKLDLPLYYDIEDPTSLQNNTQAALTNMAVVFCDTLRGKGYKVGTYTSGSIYAHNYKLNTDLLRQRGYSIWDAEWASSNSIVCDVWQYSDGGHVSGIDGYVDMDLIYNLYIAD